MRIIGCDLHARQQTLAMLDTTTGEIVKHYSEARRRTTCGMFYSSLPRPVRWVSKPRIDAVVFKSHGRTGNRMPGRSSGTDRAAERGSRT